MQRGSQSKPVDVEMEDRLEEMIRDLLQESFQQAHAPMYDTLESDSNKLFVSEVQEVVDLVVSGVKSG